jgi:hypothetical protein
MKTYWGSGGIALRILDLGTRWSWVVSFTLRPPYPQGKSSSYPLDRRLGGPQSLSGRGGEEEIPSLRQELNHRTPIVQPVAQRYTDLLCLFCLPAATQFTGWYRTHVIHRQMMIIRDDMNKDITIF